MSIEFRCTQCNKLLRTGDHTAGQQAKCPECETLLTVPPPEVVSPSPPPAGDEGTTPAPDIVEPVRSGDSENPYLSPQHTFSPPTIDPGPPRRHVPNYLVPAILCTLFCCVPFGIVAIVYAAQVNPKLTAGDHRGAAKASSNAVTWCWLSFGSGLVITVLYVMAMLAVG